jgi:hypothetical protein
MQQAAEDEDEEEPQANGAGDDGADFLLKDDENDLDLRCAAVLIFQRGRDVAVLEGG